LENKEWPGWCFYHPWDLQDGAGTGSTEYRRKWVYRSLPEMATLPWKVHCPPGWICREILKNKVPPISYSFCFIGPFAFVIEHTSYVLELYVPIFYTRFDSNIQRRLCNVYAFEILSTDSYRYRSMSSSRVSYTPLEICNICKN
jgi:hypothetical protein